MNGKHLQDQREGEEKTLTTALYRLTDEQHATVLAALRYYQQNGLGEPANRPIQIHEIATNADEVISLNDEGIDQLCEQLNIEYSQPAQKVTTRLDITAAATLAADLILTCFALTMRRTATNRFIAQDAIRGVLTELVRDAITPVLTK